MKYERAERCSLALLQWLAPHCERIMVAGSIRRGRAHCSDIDLVVVPKQIEDRNIFGDVDRRRNATWLEIDRRCSVDKWRVERAGADIVTFHAKDVQVDLFWSTEDLWGTILLCRTGSKEHNMWLANYAKSRGGKWHPSVGLYVGSCRYSQTEECIYHALGLTFIKPENREAHLLPFANFIRHTPVQA
jgi:DNA polymerase/3'-5' exonuclease PolX